MQITLNRSYCPVFVRHPLPWRIQSFPHGGWAGRLIVRDALGNPVADSVRSPLRYHRIVELYTFCVPGAVKFLYPDADPHSIHVLCNAVPAVLRNHPLPWVLIEQLYPDSRIWDAVDGSRRCTAITETSHVLVRWTVDANTSLVGNKWRKDSEVADEYMTLFELAKLAEDILFRRDCGFRTGA